MTVFSTKSMLKNARGEGAKKIIGELLRGYRAPINKGAIVSTER